MCVAIKAIFVDIDGTIVAHDETTMSERARRALAAARGRGVATFIATGRWKGNLQTIRILLFSRYLLF